MDISEALLDDTFHINTQRLDQAGQNPQLAFCLETSDVDDDAFIADAQTTSRISHARKLAKGGGFQAMGLDAHILKSIANKGFSVPTPIQRKTIPLLLAGKDVVGMAKTGSGKTAAFLVPLIAKLKSHCAVIGSRAIVLSPSRELALQTLKVTKELGRGTDLKTALLVGGDSLEEQFGLMAGNPDILIATPGRLLHLMVEMRLDLSSVQYAVFDEADRLFEMGFSAQLTEILYAMPESRQTMLFSATLPKSLVEFAKAGLREPELVRLDVDSKLSADLQTAFFTVKNDEKDGALLHILCDIIKVPTGEPENADPAQAEPSNTGFRRKGSSFDTKKSSPTSFSTLVFVQTKHHVEYLAALLRQSGFIVACVYGSLDQKARQLAAQNFRTGKVHILLVTDVAARGIDFPVLANVVNYDCPSQPKIFIHRVGRTARAGHRGWSYSLVSESDLPYLLDFELFVGRNLVMDPKHDVDYAKELVLGSFNRDRLGDHFELVNGLLGKDTDLRGLRSVASKGGKLHLKTRSPASSESARRSKQLISTNIWLSIHPLFKGSLGGLAVEREDMLARISNFKPEETVFEIGRKGPPQEDANNIMKRKVTSRSRQNFNELSPSEETISKPNPAMARESPLEITHTLDTGPDLLSASDTEELETTISKPMTTAFTSSWHDPEFFMSYKPITSNPIEDKAYSVHSGNHIPFSTAARDATMDLTNDNGPQTASESRGKRWDKKQKKYVSQANDHDGSKGGRLIRGESGQKIPMSFRSGRFDAWKKANKITAAISQVGKPEDPKLTMPNTRTGEKRYKHKSYDIPKQPDKYRDDYHRKKRKLETAKELRVGPFKDGPGKDETKNADEIRKERATKLKRREKTARAPRHV